MMRTLLLKMWGLPGFIVFDILGSRKLILKSGLQSLIFVISVIFGKFCTFWLIQYFFKILIIWYVRYFSQVNKSSFKQREFNENMTIKRFMKFKEENFRC